MGTLPAVTPRLTWVVLVAATAASAQGVSTWFPPGHWTLNPGAERSQVLTTGELLGPGRFRLAVQGQGLLAPALGTSSSLTQVRGHLLASVGIVSRFQLGAQVPVVLWQQPAFTPAMGPGRPWVTGRLGLLDADRDDPLWLSIDLSLGIPGLGQAELTGEPAGPAGSARVSWGVPFSRGVVGGEVEARALSSRVDLRGGVVLASQGIHLKGELSLRGDVSLLNPHGFGELLGGFRYVLRPLELSILVGPGWGLANSGLSWRAIAGIGFVTPRAPEEETHDEAPDCTEGTAYVIEQCPDLDFDNDGVLNRVDRCPREHGPKENEGCPWGDQDGDTLNDNVDNCPTVPGPVSNYGCPREMKQLVIIKPEKLEILEKVFFEFNKSTIKEESFELLDQVGALINAHRELTHLRIEGHTDKVGSADYNRKLSKDRARAVKTYLVEKANVDGTRLSIGGYGFDKPIASNETDEGRARNRRVEFMIVRERADEGEQ